MRPAIATTGPDFEQLRLLIIENHEVVSDALAALLGDQPDLMVVGRARSVTECDANASELPADVALIDFHLDDGTGAEAAAKIRELYPEIRMIFLSRDEGHLIRYSAIQAGASGFMSKTASSQEILDAIRRVARGESLFTPQSIASLVEKARAAETCSVRLTKREREVLVRMAAGESTRTIAQELGVSYTTIRTHLRSIEQKLDVHNKIETVVKARELGLVS